MKRFLEFLLVGLIIVALCRCDCYDLYYPPVDPPPTLAEWAYSNGGDSIGTTRFENFDCKHWANLWGTAYSTCNVDVIYGEDQVAGGNILVRTLFVNSLPDVAYTTFDSTLHKLEFWETEFIDQISPPDNGGVVNYSAVNIRPRICNPNNPTQCQNFTDAIIQPAETKELEGTAEIGVDKIWITW